MLKRREVITRADKTLRFMRCFEECIDALSKTKKMPLSVCYQRAKIYFKCDDTGTQDSNIYLFNYPIDDKATYFNILNNFEYLNSDQVLDKNVIEYLVSNSCTRINNLGRWILITKIKVLELQSISCFLLFNGVIHFRI